MMFVTYILLLSQLYYVQSVVDHYWRDYDGTIPSDAIAVDNTNDSYIGQLYVNHYGLWSGTIIPRPKDIEDDPRILEGGKVKIWELHVIDVMTKILCARDPSKFIWFKTTAATSKKDLERERPIVGGYVHVDNVTQVGVLHIGQTRYNKRAIVVNILESADKTVLFNSKGGIAWKYPASEYEVLVHRDT